MWPLAQNSQASATKVILSGKNQSDRFELAKKRLRAAKAKEYRKRLKARKQDIARQESLKWESLGGGKKVCMRVHQYELPYLKRIVQLGTCPTARGSFIPTARVASHMGIDLYFGTCYSAIF